MREKETGETRTLEEVGTAQTGCFVLLFYTETYTLVNDGTHMAARSGKMYLDGQQ